MNRQQGQRKAVFRPRRTARPRAGPTAPNSQYGSDKASYTDTPPRLEHLLEAAKTQRQHRQPPAAPPTTSSNCHLQLLSPIATSTVHLQLRGQGWSPSRAIRLGSSTTSAYALCPSSFELKRSGLLAPVVCAIRCTSFGLRSPGRLAPFIIGAPWVAMRLPGVACDPASQRR